jgi:hypothetical protein
MNLSPTQRNSPKEKRTFTFFRSRTLSSSSNDSSSSVAGSSSASTSAAAQSSTSPRLSPRLLFERVRKRSQSDAKSQTSVENLTSPSQSQPSPNGSSANGNNGPIDQKALQLHLQQQLAKSKLKVPGGSSAASNSASSSGSASRKHLSHSISEENDETINNERYLESGYGDPMNMSYHSADGTDLNSPSINRLKVLLFFTFFFKYAFFE